MHDRFHRVGALALLAGLLAVAAGCTGGSGAQPSGPRPAPVPRYQVVIDNFTFSPPSLTVPVGATVNWVNHDDVPHTATSTAKPKLFDSGALDTDDRFAHTFTEPGTYPYYCAVHPRMTGEIVVK